MSLRSLTRPRAAAAEAGQGLVEYALLTALIALAAMFVLTQMGNGITGVFTRIAAKLAGVG